MNIEYHPLTTLELSEAVDYYNKKRPGLGERFHDEVLSTIERIRTNPGAYTEVDGFRRALVKKFPYSVIYRIVSVEVVRILVIRHHKRNPDYGSSR